MARTGRRPGSTRTREAILEAARSQFGEKGYDMATIRGIAEEAGVDPALVYHFFGGKQQVFLAAMKIPFDPVDLIEEIFGGRGRDHAEAILRVFLGVWEDPSTRAPFLALVRSAANNEQAARVLRGFMRAVVFERASQLTGLPELRVSAIATHLLGLVTLRYVIRVEPLASASVEEVIASHAPALRAILEQPG